VTDIESILVWRFSFEWKWVLGDKRSTFWGIKIKSPGTDLQKTREEVPSSSSDDEDTSEVENFLSTETPVNLSSFTFFEFDETESVPYDELKEAYYASSVGGKQKKFKKFLKALLENESEPVSEANELQEDGHLERVIVGITLEDNLPDE
jgi:hypothetical protein